MGEVEPIYKYYVPDSYHAQGTTFYSLISVYFLSRKHEVLYIRSMPTSFVMYSKLFFF